MRVRSTCVHVAVGLYWIISVDLAIRVDEVEPRLGIGARGFELVTGARQEIFAINSDNGAWSAQMVIMILKMG